MASVLTFGMLGDGVRLPDCHGLPWFFSWSARGAHHPDWLTAEHFEALAAAATGPLYSPDELRSTPPTYPRSWFARKVSSQLSGDLLDRVDAELRLV